MKAYIKGGTKLESEKYFKQKQQKSLHQIQERAKGSKMCMDMGNLHNPY